MIVFHFYIVLNSKKKENVEKHTWHNLTKEEGPWNLNFKGKNKRSWTLKYLYTETTQMPICPTLTMIKRRKTEYLVLNRRIDVGFNKNMENTSMIM